MLDFLYTGSIRVPSTEKERLMNEHGEEILRAADKYAIAPLKECVERYFASLVTNHSLVQTIALADRYSASLLKDVCIRYMARHRINVTSAEQWSVLAKERPELANELLAKSIRVAEGRGGESGRLKGGESNTRSKKNGVGMAAGKVASTSYAAFKWGKKKISGLSKPEDKLKQGLIWP